MRVLFWSENFWPATGGIEVLVARLTVALRDRGYELVVVAQDSPDLPAEEEYQGVPVHRFPFHGALQSRDLKRVRELREQVAALKRRFRPDLVSSYHAGPGIYFHLNTPVSGLPELANLHVIYPGALLREEAPIRRWLRSASWTVACSAAVLAATRNDVPEITPRSSVLLNALPEPALTPDPLPFDAPVLLCVGRLSGQKRFDLALRAFARLVRRYSTVRLVIAGDGPRRTELEQQAVDLGVADQVRFLGWVHPDEVPRLINTSTVILMPSRQEPFGLVALQAAQMARPIVASRVDGLPEVVADGETGLLVPSGDDDALAEAVALLIDRPELAVDLGRAARSRARERFGWQAHVDGYDALCRRLRRERDATAR